MQQILPRRRGRVGHNLAPSSSSTHPERVGPPTILRLVICTFGLEAFGILVDSQGESGTSSIFNDPNIVEMLLVAGLVVYVLCLLILQQNIRRSTSDPRRFSRLIRSLQLDLILFCRIDPVV